MADLASSTRRALLKGAAILSITPTPSVAREAETLDQRRDRLFAELGDTLEALTGTRWTRMNDRNVEVVMFSEVRG